MVSYWLSYQLYVIYLFFDSFCNFNISLFWPGSSIALKPSVLGVSSHVDSCSSNMAWLLVALGRSYFLFRIYCPLQALIYFSVQDL